MRMERIRSIGVEEDKREIIDGEKYNVKQEYKHRTDSSSLTRPTEAVRVSTLLLGCSYVRDKRTAIWKEGEDQEED